MLSLSDGQQPVHCSSLFRVDHRPDDLNNSGLALLTISKVRGSSLDR
jgi:hypothetical protein